MNPQLVSLNSMDELFEHIIGSKKTLMCSNHYGRANAKQALSISDRGYVLVTGQNKFEGSGNELLQNSRGKKVFCRG